VQRGGLGDFKGEGIRQDFVQTLKIMKMKDLVDDDLLYSSKGKGLAAKSMELDQNTCIPYCTYLRSETCGAV
jgi:hypothetical protein